MCEQCRYNARTMSCFMFIQAGPTAGIISHHLDMDYFEQHTLSCLISYVPLKAERDSHFKYIICLLKTIDTLVIVS